MSENKQPEQNQDLTGEPSPEELEAAQAADEFDAMNAASEAQAQLAVLQAKNTELSDNYLRAKAEAENARRRAEDEFPRRASSPLKASPKACCRCSTAWKPA